MILVDTSILSTLARVEEPDLLFSVFPGQDLCVAPGVYAELRAGLRAGYGFLQTPALG